VVQALKKGAECSVRIHYLQNDPLVGPGSIEEWANEKGYPISFTRVYEETGFPSVHDFDLLVVLGGTMGAYEEEAFPWLSSEKRFIREAVQREKLVLGICLGVQLLAEALGSRAYPHVHKEIGWWPIELTEEAANFPLFKGLPATFTAFQWHGDTFDLPEGAVRLASSKACMNQAMGYGERVVGLQFHPESTNEGIGVLVEYCSHDLAAGPYVQNSADLLNRTANVEQGRAVLYTLLDNMEQSFQERTRELEQSHRV
jgi:GMP synthase-like glutamine amidotransferase